MVRSSGHWFLVCALLVGAHPLHVRADEPSPEEASLALFDEGVAHLRDEDFAEAARAFAESYRRLPRASTMCNLALTYDRWSGTHRPQAIRAYRSCANDDREDRFRVHAEQRIRVLERELALEAEERGAPDNSADSDPLPIAPPTSGPLTDESTSRSEHPPESASGWPSVGPLFWIGVAAATVGVAALGTAVALGVDANADAVALSNRVAPSGEIVAGSPEEAEYRDLAMRIDVALALYIGGGIATGLGVVLGAVDLVSASTRAAPSVALGLGPGSFAIRGTF